jgi:hypothetical protein
MREWLIIRALRYQWLAVLTVFGVVFGALQPARARFDLHAMPPQRSADSAKALPLVSPVLADRSEDVGWAEPVLSAQPAAAAAPQRGTLSRLLASERLVDVQISEARQRLQALAVEIENPLKAGVESPPPAPMKVAVARPVARPEEIALRHEIAEQRTALEVLRTTDTDAHPDVIEARDTLAHLQGRLTAYLKTNSSAAVAQLPEPHTVTAAVPVPLPVGRPAAPDLSRLLRTRAELERQIRALTATAVPTEQASVQPVSALLESDPVVPLISTQGAPDRRMPLLFEVYCCLLAGTAAVGAGVFVEYRGDHIPGPHALQKHLPESVPYFRAVPRMRA